MAIKKEIEIGLLWTFKLTDYDQVQLTPAECVTDGPYRGCMVVYVFKRGLAQGYLEAHGSADDLLIPPLMVGKENFGKGVMIPVATSTRLKVPYFPAHIFSDDQRTYYVDVFDNRVNPVSWIPGIPGVHSIGGLCDRICKALGVKADCQDLGMKAINKAFPVRKLSDSSLNRRQAVMAINFSPRPEGQPLELGELEEKAEAILRASQLGSSDGIGIGRGGSELTLVIKRGRYPEAVAAVRDLLAKEGIADYEIWGYETK